MFEFRIKNEELDRFIQNLEQRAEARIDRALYDVQTEWRVEFDRQQRRLRYNWTALRPRYQEEKDQAYRQRARTGVRYNSILKRTGRMLEGYKDDITVNLYDKSVVVYYPTIYARVHEKGSGRTNAGHGNIPARPFEWFRFTRRAQAVLEKALVEGLTDE